MIGPIACIGGKRRLARTIVSLLPSHTTYVEPFAGGAQVLFAKPPSQVEVLNDLDSDIVNLFRVLQRHPEELARVLRWQPLSREVFESHRARAPADATDIERAARFYYLQRHAFGGKRTGQSFRTAIIKRPKYRPHALQARFAGIADRLEEVVLEHQPYEAVLTRYDRPTTLFYCDPPYVDVHLYPHRFTDAHFEDLAQRLGVIQGKFLLSLNDTPKTRQWFGHFICQPVELTYTARRHPTRVSELLIANYPLPPLT